MQVPVDPHRSPCSVTHVEYAFAGVAAGIMVVLLATAIILRACCTAEEQLGSSRLLKSGCVNEPVRSRLPSHPKIHNPFIPLDEWFVNGSAIRRGHFPHPHVHRELSHLWFRMARTCHHLIRPRQKGGWNGKDLDVALERGRRLRHRVLMNPHAKRAPRGLEHAVGVGI